MPKLKLLTVSLSEVLEVRGECLDEPEIWSVLCQSAMKIQDLYISGKHFNPGRGSFDLGLPIITPESLFMDREGCVSFGCIKSAESRVDFVAPEISLLKSFGDAEIEKMLVYSLGKTLRFASSYNRQDSRGSQPPKQFLSATLKETLNFMHQENCTFRHSLASLFEIILQYARVGSRMKPFAMILVSLFEEIMGTSVDANLADTNEELDSLVNENYVEEEEKSVVNEERTRNLSGNGAKMNLDENSPRPSVILVEKSQNASDVEFVSHCSQPLVKVSEDDDDDDKEEAVQDAAFRQFNDAVKEENNDDNEIDRVDARLDFPTQHNDSQSVSSSKLSKYYSENSSSDQQKFILGPEFVIKSYNPVIRLRALQPEHSIYAIRVVTVISLTGQRFAVEIDAESSTNSEIFHAVAAYESLKERFLFGLAYKRGDEFIFLDLEANVAKLMHKICLQQQTGLFNLEALTLYLRVKFYVNRSTITDPSAKRLQYLQLRKDILEERISCELQSAILLASLALQAEFHSVSLEDCEDFHLEHYVPRWIIQRPDSDAVRAELIQFHRSRSVASVDGIMSTSMSPEVARNDFTKHVQGLRDHGYHFHVVQRDKKDLKSAILLGVSLAGISIFAPLDTDQGENKQELQRYAWQQITRITHDKRHFYLTLQSRNLKDHFMKCRFHTREYLGQYLFNLSFAHHRLHLRLLARLDDSTLRPAPPSCGGIAKEKHGLLVPTETNPGDTLTSNGEDLLAQQCNSPIQTTNVTKPRSKTFRDLKILRSKKKTVSEVQPDGQNGRKKASRKPSLLSNLFRKANLNSHKEETQKATQFYVIDTSIRSHQSDSPVFKIDEIISSSLNERFANLSGLERIERRISDVILIRDENGSLGITVCEGADGATYVQSVASVHRGSDIRPGDRIMAVNGRYVEAMSYESVVEIFKNSRTLVNLTVSQNLDDQLDDDVFEQQTPTDSATTRSCTTNGDDGKIADDVTYECHDADLRNEITSMWFVQEKPADVHRNNEQKIANESNMADDKSSSDVHAEVTLDTTLTGGDLCNASEQPKGANLFHEDFNQLQTNSSSLQNKEAAKVSSSSSVLEEQLCLADAIAGATLDGAAAAAAATNGFCQQLTEGTDDANEEVLNDDEHPSEDLKFGVVEEGLGFCESLDERSAKSQTSAIMVTKPSDSLEKNSGVASSNGDSSVNGISSPVRTVLWNPRHSGTVRSKVFNFEEQSSANSSQIKPLPVPKSMSLHKFSPAEYNALECNNSNNNNNNKSQFATPASSAKLCFAVTGKPYPNRRLPQLARSKTMPTVYREHVAGSNSNAGTLKSTPLSPSSPSDDRPPSTSFKLPWLSQLKQGSALCRSPRLSLDQSEFDVRQPSVARSPSSHIKQFSSEFILDNDHRQTSRQQDQDKAFAFEGRGLRPTVRPRLSLSTDDVTRPSSSLSHSFVAIAKEKLRKQSTCSTVLPEVPHNANYFLAKSSTADNVLSVCKQQQRIAEEEESPRRNQTTAHYRELFQKPSMLFEDEKIRQLQSWLPFVNPKTTFQVRIQKGSRGLGLSVCGGKDQDPDDRLSQLIRIKRLYPLYPASETGQLKVGDLLLVVNGRHLTGLNQSEVLDALRVASSSIDLAVCRPPAGALPSVPQTGGLLNSSSLSLSSMNLLGLSGDSVGEPASANHYPKEFEVAMEKLAGSLGFTMHRSEKPHSGHYVKALVKDPALTDGRLRPGDQILKVNGTDISALSQNDAIALLRSAPATVLLLVSREDETLLSPLSPLSTIFPSDQEDFRSRRDKKVLRKEALDMLSDKGRRRSQESGCSGSSVSPVNRRHLSRKDRSPSSRTDSDTVETLSNASDLEYHDDQMATISVKAESHLKVPRPSHLGLNNGSSRSSGEGSISPASCSPSLGSTTWPLPNGHVSPVSPARTMNGANFPFGPTNNYRRPGSVCAASPSNYDRSDDLTPQVWPISLTVDLDRIVNSRLGFSLLGIDDGHLKGTYIRKIHPDTLAGQDGRLKPGDNLLRVNGLLVRDLATNSVIEMLRQMHGRIILDVIRDPVVSSKVLAASQAIRSPSLVRKQVNNQ